MNPKRWQQIESLYQSACKLERAERDALLAEACRGDDELRREVESLLGNRSDDDVLRTAGAVEIMGHSLPSDDLQSFIGQKMESYEILSLLGVGGMGQVYRAKDLKLGRDVAIKVLPASLANDSDRGRRLEREARLLAALNHPNIAAIYDLIESKGERCLVLEYVDGETLEERLEHGRLSIDNALNICLQIAEALDTAHRAGILHRDIKPANVKIKADGRVKVLDFGLARAIANPELGGNPSSTPTLVTLDLSGGIAGTPAYMSPEQVRGETVDKRTDIWAFGCVLYELLAGQRPFLGGSIPEVLASVLKSEPDWTALPSETPQGVQTFLRRCLEKDLTRRLDDIATARTELQPRGSAPMNLTRTEVAQSGNAIRSLAVLPFVNTGGNPEMDYLSDGLTESIIFGLSQLPQLRVMSRSAVFRYRDRSHEAQSICWAGVTPITLTPTTST